MNCCSVFTRWFGIALFGFVVASQVSSQTAPGATAVASKDYSFTISTTQPWTDTGVDLQPGEFLEITSGTAQVAPGTVPDRHAITGATASCDPQGVSGSSSQGRNPPVADALPGALIARLQVQGTGFPVGGSKELRIDEAGHLFFGVNAEGDPPCKGSFSVKVRVVQSASTSASTAVHPATGTEKQTPTKPPDIKQKLAAAAQALLAAQFGTGAPQQQTASSSAVVPGNTATPAVVAGAAVPLTTSNTPLDSALRRDIDGLPRRVHDLNHNLGDMVNFVFVGSEAQMQAALDAANWHVADRDSKAAALKAIVETYEKKDYLQMPMSRLYLFGRVQDFGYEQAEAISVVASRHHFRLWKAAFTWNGQPVWAGAGTHDIGFEKDQRNGKVTHKIDPAVDGERDNIGASLQKAGKVKSMSYYLPPNPVQDAKNATGGGYQSDGRILVVFLQ